MKVAQLWSLNNSRKIDWELGSDGVVYLDGRLGKSRIHNYIMDIVEKRKLTNRIVGYTVHKSVSDITNNPINLINL